MAASVTRCSLLAQRHRPSFSVVLTTGRQQAILHHGPLPSTCEFMQSARIACPCFTRPKGLSWDSRRALHKSPPEEFDWHDPPGRKLLGQSIPHDANNVCPFTTNLSSSTFAWVVIELDVFDDSAMTSSSLASPLLLGQTASGSRDATFSL